MWRCPRCYEEFYGPSVCGCGYDGSKERDTPFTGNAFDTALRVLGYIILAAFLWKYPRLLLNNPRFWSIIVTLTVALIIEGWRWIKRGEKPN